MGSRAGYFWAIDREIIEVSENIMDTIPEKLQLMIRRFQGIVKHDVRKDTSMGFSERDAHTIFELEGVVYRIGFWNFDCSQEYYSYLSSCFLEDALDYIGAEKIFYEGSAD